MSAREIHNIAHVLHSWQKKNDQELEVLAGEVLTVLSISEDRQWALCVSPSLDRGFVPCGYLKVVKNSESRSPAPDNTVDESGYLRPRLEASLRQPDLLTAAQRQDMRKENVVPNHCASDVKRMVQLFQRNESQERNEIAVPAAVPRAAVVRHGSTTRDERETSSSSEHETASSSERDIVSTDSGASFCLQDHQPDETLVCYRVGWQPHSVIGQQPGLAVRVGELMLSSEQRGDLMQGARCADPTFCGWVPKSALQPASSLDMMPWFVGVMTREEAEALLLTDTVESGTFLVRVSETASGYVISIKSVEGAVPTLRHRKCNEDNGQYTAWSQLKFRDISDLIIYHSDGRELSIPYDKYSAFSYAYRKPTMLQPKPCLRRSLSPYADSLNLDQALDPQRIPPALNPQRIPPALDPQRIPPALPPKPTPGTHQSVASNVHPRQLSQATPPMNLNHPQDGSQYLNLRRTNSEGQGVGKPPPGLVQSHGLSGPGLRPVRPVSQRFLAPGETELGTHEPSSATDDEGWRFNSSLFSAVVPRNQLPRSTRPLPTPPVDSNGSSSTGSSSNPTLEVDATEGNVQTNDPSPTTRGQAYIQAVGFPLPLRPSFLHSISIPSASGANEVPPMRSISLSQSFTASKGTGAVSKHASGDASALEMYGETQTTPEDEPPLIRPVRGRRIVPPKNQEDLRAIELENRALESEFESWRVSRLAQIGCGYYGEVWKVKIKNTEKIMALKTFNKERMDEKLFMAEAKTMMALTHPNLVKLRGICSEPESIFMLLDLHSHGSVLDYLTKGLTLSPAEKLNVMRGVLSGMKYLSEEGFVHRDLAARNVLMTDDKTPKVADFGLAQMIKADGRIEHDNQKTPWKWTAPEAMCGGNLWSSKCDVWSYGVFCWELYSNCATQPYPEVSNSRYLLHFLLAGNRLDRPAECNETVFGFIYQCWEYDHSARPSFGELWRFLNL